MTINNTKSNIVHFRPQSVQRANFNFICGNDSLAAVDKYTYLGIVINEFLDYSVTAKAVAQSAGRALGLLIAKCKIVGGMPYDAYTKLYDSIVWPIISYGASIWGVKSFSCINAVHNRAMRFFLGVGKYTPNDAVSGEMAWVPPIIRQWKSIVGHWSRLCNTPVSRVNKRIALWANGKACSTYKSWFYYVNEKMLSLDLDTYTNMNGNVPKSTVVSQLYDKMMSAYVNDWHDSINRPEGIRRRGRNKLRNYCKYKINYSVENYCELIMPPKHKAA